jgi:TamB, inner membrane protein subunit of TAM complex
LRLRYPAGVVSSANVSLLLEGPVTLPMLRGQVVVLAADYRPRIDRESGLFGIAAGGALGGGGGGAAVAPPVSTEPSGTPLGLDIKVISGVMPFIDNAAGRIEGRVNIDVGGTVDRPAVTGQIRIERGQWFFGENRYTVLPGTIDFSNPIRFEPYFDVEARTRARASGEAFDVTVRVRGTFEKLEPTLSSEPWLSEVQIVSLLLGGTPDIDAAALQVPNSAEQARAIQTASAVLLTSPITATLSSVVREVLPFEVVQIMPQFTNPNDEFALRQLTATARFTVGKRISERVYLTYSRNLTGDQREIILLEFDQNDRVSWVLSRNEDRKFALDFRIRHVF